MNTQIVAKRFNWFGLVAALPAVGCVGFLAYIAADLDRQVLAALFTAVGAVMAYGSTKIR